MTLSAYTSCTATSSAVVSFIVPSGPSAAPVDASEPPKPPASTDMSGRFMAWLISTESVTPAAPTSAPATMSATLSIARPLIATAVPVHALSTEMTTGMSAPPIGMTNTRP